MYYAILAYHAEGVVEGWTPEEDEALMAELLAINDRLVKQKHLGPAARLGPTQGAVTLRGPGAGTVIDGPFAETKEQLLGFYIVDVENLEAGLQIARDLGKANPGGAYELRPISIYQPGIEIK